MRNVYAPVAQLDRVSDSDSEGRAFESHQAYKKKHRLQPVLFMLSFLRARRKRERNFTSLKIPFRCGIIIAKGGERNDGKRNFQKH